MSSPVLIDTHCHIHARDYPLDAEEVLRNAREAGVTRVVCIGTDAEDSKRAVEFAEKHNGVYATVGVHPAGRMPFLCGIGGDKVGSKTVAVGEVGLDYHYKPYDREAQIRLFEEMLQMAVDAGLPVVFHVREAFEDFWPVVDGFLGRDLGKLRGVVHGFSERSKMATEYVEKALERGFYISLNGIATFSKDKDQMAAFAAVPQNRLMLETDAPYLAPPPFRGKPNQPAYVRGIAQFLADKRGVSLEELARATTKNAEELFGFAKT